MLEPKNQFRGCVFYNRNALGSHGAELRAEMDLSPEDLRKQGPTSPLHAPSSGARSRWDILCLGELLAIPMGLMGFLGGTKILTVGIPDPCCDPSSAEL
jgi:hypothetical protein